VIILEGPDGGGKSTLAAEISAATGAVVQRHGTYPGISTGPALARVYLESMLPAVLGYAPVVLDRSWLSEVPYGTAMRGGKFRTDLGDERVLERVAWRCGAVVVLLLPPLETIRATWRSRRGDEYLDGEEKLEAVRSAYTARRSSLPTIVYDYTSSVHRAMMTAVADRLGPRHPIEASSAGNLAAPVAIVGDSLGDRSDAVGFYRWPFASTRRGGTGRWLTAHLRDAGVGEEDVLWANADEAATADVIRSHPRRLVAALGALAAEALASAGIEARTFDRPEWHRLHAHRGATYGLGAAAAEALR
jgi:thymidylate kinase